MENFNVMGYEIEPFVEMNEVSSFNSYVRFKTVINDKPKKFRLKYTAESIKDGEGFAFAISALKEVIVEEIEAEIKAHLKELDG